MDTTAIVILAAGKGKRMGTVLPKVLLPLNGKPLLKHITDTVATLPLHIPPLIVIGYRGEEIQQQLGEQFIYVTEHELLGTAHALQSAQTAVKETGAERVITLYGDMPLITRASISRLFEKHRIQQHSPLTITTVTVPTFDAPFERFEHYGRVTRDESGAITGIVEHKDATPEEQHIQELNAGYFCIDTQWLWKELPKITNTNAQDEYYVTDLVAQAYISGHTIASITLEPQEAMGVNTPEDLAQLTQLSTHKLK